MVKPLQLRPRQRLGKYRIVRRITLGGFADVYEAEDTIECMRVALRVPRADLVDEDLLQSFRREVRLLSGFEHPNVLPIKNADQVEGIFVVCTQLGDETLADALERRMTVAKALDYTEQILRGVAYAHEQNLIHCDIKPDNMILFRNGRLRLTDFGIAMVAFATMASTSGGTLGYLAPEQALGRPSLRSDVFAIGLVVWEMFSGKLPEWPFESPLPNLDRVRRKLHPELIQWIGRCLVVDQRRRPQHAGALLESYLKLKRAGKLLATVRNPKTDRRVVNQNLQALQRRTFDRKFRVVLALHHTCSLCKGSMSESMRSCPWCGLAPKRFVGTSAFPGSCGRCARGRKLDWRYCAWCYGAGHPSVASRSYPDKRYSAHCANAACGGELMRFMAYCPWCRAKVRRKWTFEGFDSRCKGCGWAIASEYWNHCPWCTTKIRK